MTSPIKANYIDNNTPTRDSVVAAWLNAVASAVNTVRTWVASGIPETALDTAVNASLNRADSSLQTLDADLLAIGALTPANDDVLQRKASVWTNRTMAQLKTDLGVAADILAAQRGAAVNTQTAAYTLVLADAGRPVEMNSATAVNLTVPPSIFSNGDMVEVRQVGAGQVTFVAGAGVAITQTDTQKTRKQWSVVYVIQRSTNTFLLTGDTE